MGERYKYCESDEATRVKEDVAAYPQSITIPITLPTTGSYSVEYLKEEMTNFALKLLRRPKQEKAMSKKIHISERIKALSAVPASSSKGDYKEEFVSIMSDKF